MRTRQRPAEDRYGEAGYTLVELLIVLALLGILSVLLVSGLQFGARAWEAGGQASRNVREIAVAQARLRRAIGEAYPYLSTADPTNPHVVFDGGERSLTLLAPDAAAATAGRSLTTIEARAGERGLDLIVRAAPELASGDARASAPEVLVRDVDSVTFAYLADDNAWLPAWRNEKRLPRLVRITVSFPEGDTRAWPELIVSPRVAADVSCVFDALTKSCRGR